VLFGQKRPDFLGIQVLKHIQHLIQHHNSRFLAEHRHGRTKQIDLALFSQYF